MLPGCLVVDLSRKNEARERMGLNPVKGGDVMYNSVDFLPEGKCLMLPWQNISLPLGKRGGQSIKINLKVRIMKRRRITGVIINSSLPEVRTVTGSDGSVTVCGYSAIYNSRSRLLRTIGGNSFMRRLLPVRLMTPIFRTCCVISIM